MAFNPDDLTSALPAPRDDEPAALRGDIVDEIADHLTCATRREQLSGRVDETEAHRRAIHRFGDPARICLQLWWARMRGTIMTQRSLVGMFAGTIAVFAAGTFAMWQFHREQVDLIFKSQSAATAQMQEQQGIFQKLLESSQATSAAFAKQAEANAEDVRRMRALMEKNLTDFEWSSVEIKFVGGTVDGPPMAGATIRMAATEKSLGMPTFTGTSNADGIIAFDRVRYGDYEAAIKSPFGEDLTTIGPPFEVNVLPGQKKSLTIVCPAGPPVPQSVTVKVEWPDDLKSRGLELHLPREPLLRRTGEYFWRSTADYLPDAPKHEAFISANGDILAVRRGITGGGTTTLRGRIGEYPEFEFAYRNSSSVDRPPALQWPSPDFRWHWLTVLIDFQDALLMPDASNLSPERDRWAVQRVDASQWEYRLESGSPGSLLLKPDEKSIAAIRKLVATVDDVAAKEADLKSEAPEGPPDSDSDDSTSE
jgi:hypothetical protein